VRRRFDLIAAALWLLSAGCAGTRAAGGPEPASDEALAARVGPSELIAYSDSAIASGQPEVARRALQRAAVLAPQDASVRLGYGRYYTATLRYKDAKTEFERAAALDPRSPEPYYWLGVAYLKAGERAQAAASFSSALEIDPAHPEARAALRPLAATRYAAAGIPPEYAFLPERPSISRGELGVALAVELGADPERPTWRGIPARAGSALQDAWGGRWIGAAADRGWIAPYPDGDFHLEDPVTRGSLAILLAQIAHRATAFSPMVPPSGEEVPTAGATQDPSLAFPVTFPDLGPRDYLASPAARAVAFGLPTRDGGRFDAPSFVTGLEALRALQGLARSMGATPVVSGEPK